MYAIESYESHNVIEIAKSASCKAVPIEKKESKDGNQSRKEERVDFYISIRRS